MKNSTAIILILVAIGLFYTFTSVRYQKIKGLQAEAAQYNEILDSVEALTDKRNELQVRYREVPKTEIDRLGKVLPDNIDTVRLAMDFDAIASKYGISIKSIKAVGDEQDNSTVIDMGLGGEKYDTATVSFSFVASYQNFRKFMKDIEQSLRIIDTESVSFQSTDTGLYEYRVVIKTYWLK